MFCLRVWCVGGGVCVCVCLGEAIARGNTAAAGRAAAAAQHTRVQTHLDAGLHDLRRDVLALDLRRQLQLRLGGRQRGGRALCRGRKRGALKGLDGRLRLRVARVVEVVDHVLAREGGCCVVGEVVAGVHSVAAGGAQTQQQRKARALALRGDLLSLAALSPSVARPRHAPLLQAAAGASQGSTPDERACVCCVCVRVVRARRARDGAR